MRRFLEWKGYALVALTARIYLAVVFLMACYHKLLDPAAFALDIATYQIMPLATVNLMAIVLPWVELVAGLMLLVGFRTRAGALLVAAMMTVFTAAIAVALRRGLEMSCGCFASQGAAEDPIAWVTILRDLGWLALALYVLFMDRNSIGIDRLLGRRPGTLPATTEVMR
jgi:putative oxidoreductase